ncbi:MAG: NAD(+) synthase [Lachnospiraceae bacterium]|nr:NAD(+) synthase [Lachnospiraceae bacterium]
MLNGFVKVAAATPDIQVADCDFNSDEIVRSMKKAASEGVKLLVFPELVITGYTCSDLFLQEPLLTGALSALAKIIKASRGLDMLVTVGLPVTKNGKLYNVAALLLNGKLLAMVPKRYIPNYSEFYEARHFAAAPEYLMYFGISDVPYDIRDEFEGILSDVERYSSSASKGSICVPFYNKLVLENVNMPGLAIGVEICEDLWTHNPPSGNLAAAGATVIVNPSASDETTGKSYYRKNLVAMQSARLVSAYIYADAGEGESTTDLIFAAHNMIAENGTMLAESERFKNGMITTEIDIGRLVADRRRMNTYETIEAKALGMLYSLDNSESFANAAREEGYVKFAFAFKNLETPELTRFVDPHPFVPSDEAARASRCSEIINMQALGLKKRIVHTHAKTVTIGVSGGLDSTLALLVAKRAFELAGLPAEGIVAVTMPCFGTTDRTYNNAVKLIKEIGATFREVRINDAVLQHFKDIGHDEAVKDVTYENCQARERTQVIMDIAGETGGFVVGTGDLSELALGWATYNGDHMSMYGVNASIPKTLVRYLVAYFADIYDNLREVLLDILDTPVSPELLPPVNGEIVQKTEDKIGPYELHDFFLYYVMRFGFMPTKIFTLAKKAFVEPGTYDEDTIVKWLKNFYSRFFAQQFKRSCLPDGPKVGSIAVSPRGDLRMPSDAVKALWMQDIENIEL